MLSTIFGSLALVSEMPLIFLRQFRFVPLSQAMGRSIYLLCDLSLHAINDCDSFLSVSFLSLFFGR